MKIFIRRIGLAGLAMLIMSSCGGDDVTPKDDVTALEARTVSRAAAISIQTGISNSPIFFAAAQSPAPAAQPIFFAAPQSPAAQSPAPAAQLSAGSPGEFGLTCPDVTVTRTVNFLTVNLNYGTAPGCISQLDGQPHSGQIAIVQDLRQDLRRYSFDFTAYTTGDLLIDGQIDGMGNRDSVEITVNDLFLQGETGNTAIDADVHGIHDDNGTPLILIDDSWQVRGAGGNTEVGWVATVVATDHKTYFIAIDNTTPVVLKAGCPWPVAGRISITVLLASSTNASEPTLLDFGTGACDDAALVTLPGGQTQTIHLSEVSVVTAE